jgi:hypothetical protein
LNLKNPVDFRMKDNKDGSFTLVSSGKVVDNPHHYYVNYRNVNSWEYSGIYVDHDGIIGNDSPFTVSDVDSGDGEFV